ncbi:hypothetical protein CEXT_448051 [Caerostris extrusa]|uniref:LAGLIDADG homing endonuclease n=1 Tax=Caerostris extrusa TaxID=172846 RepID=A0AAV4PHX2_CAEEX|nr:hypothetical protein CEXT_448051 [Caerostris extrusa]
MAGRYGSFYGGERTFSGPSAKYPRRRTRTSTPFKLMIQAKKTPQGLCRRLVSAHQEMEVIYEILTSAKKSEFQNDYLQLNDNLSKKKEYLLEWVSRFRICPIAECKIHNANLKSNQLKNTTKRAASEISSHDDKVNSSKDF